MSHPKDYVRLPRWRDQQAAAQWHEQACFEAAEAEDWDTAAEVEIPDGSLSNEVLQVVD